MLPRADFRLDRSLLADISEKELLKSSTRSSESESSTASTDSNHLNGLAIWRWRDRGLQRLCLALGSHPLLSLLCIFVFLSPLHSFYFFNPLQIESDVRRGFAQRDGRSAAEFKTFADYYHLPFEGLEIWVILATPKRNSNETTITVDGELFDEITRLDAFVRNFSTSFKENETTKFDETWSGEDLNAMLGYVKQIHPLVGLVPNFNLNYPIAQISHHKLHLATHFFMVNDGLSVGNKNVPMKTSRFIALWYMSKAENYTQRKKLEAIELGLFNEFLGDNFSQRFSIEMFGDQVANAEMLRGTLLSLKLFILGGVLMVMFMLAMLRHLTWKSRILMTIGAVLSPMLATLSTFSLLGWLGVRVNSMMCITPFLVLGIGVDDAFLLLHQWRKVRKERCHLRANEVLEMIFHHVGPSMAVTSITNTLAFGIGISNPSPQMSTFCLGTTLAVFLDLIYEFAIFTPIMVLFFDEKKETKNVENEMKWLPTWAHLVDVFYSPIGRLLIVLICCVMYTMAGIGLSQMVPSFEPAKTFPADSELIHALRSFEFIQTEYWPVNYITKKVPKTWKEVEEWEEMLIKLETRDHCYGSTRRSANFLRDFYEGECKAIKRHK
ncbi:unnamed protein product, partial [Mesorhabditis belari]|uniref:SSD domain-containing protein n=1 Tax=Mesorhabditis belari TaxID=2138241 RepID=A0AAF3J464_9BILA